jgi:hypothetical protein
VFLAINWIENCICKSQAGKPITEIRQGLLHKANLKSSTIRIDDASFLFVVEPTTKLRSPVKFIHRGQIHCHLNRFDHRNNHLHVAINKVNYLNGQGCLT